MCWHWTLMHEAGPEVQLWRWHAVQEFLQARAPGTCCGIAPPVLTMRPAVGAKAASDSGSRPAACAPPDASSCCAHVGQPSQLHHNPQAPPPLTLLCVLEAVPMGDWVDLPAWLPERCPI